jgi:hypothetical protein
MRVLPLSSIELVQHAIPGIWFVPAEHAQAMADALAERYGTRTLAAMAYAEAIGGSPFAAYRQMMRWQLGKQRMKPETYDLLWTLVF